MAAAGSLVSVSPDEEDHLIETTKDYKPASAADYIITFHWDKDNREVPDANKEVRAKDVIDSCFVQKEEAQKVFTELWKACGECKDKSLKVKLSVLREAILNDFRTWLPRIGFDVSCFKSLDEDELFMRISLTQHEVQQFYAEKFLVHCQLSEATVRKLNIAYPEGTPPSECSPPYVPYEDGFDLTASQSLGLGSNTLFKKSYKLRDPEGSLLRQVDRVRIIRRAILRLIDLDDLIAQGIISGKFPCHILAPLEDFREEWATFQPMKLLGCFAEQPLLRIRNYYGEQVAFYFAWLSLTIRRLLLIGIIGVVWFALSEAYIFLYAHTGMCEDTCEDMVDPLDKCSAVESDRCGGCAECEHLGVKGRIELAMQLGYGVIMGIWATVYIASWKRQEYRLRIEWDMQNADERGSLRADYRGEMLESPLNANEMMKQFPEQWIQIYKIIVRVINVGFVSISVTAIFATRGLENYFSRDLGLGTMGRTVVSVLIAVQIQVFNFIWQTVARKLVEFENPRTEAEYGNELINKLAPFGLITTYNTFVYIALMQHNAYRAELVASPCPADDCVAYLNTSLFTTFLTQAILVVVGMAVPYIMLWRSLKKEAAIVEEEYKKQGKTEVPERSFMEKQGKMGVYDQDAQITDYMNCVTVLGYVLLFGAAMPSAAFIALVVLLFQFRANAYLLVRLSRRPYPTMCSGIGSWNSIIDTLSWIGLIFYIGIPILNHQLNDHLPRETKLMMFFICEHLIVLGKVIASSFMSLEPKEAKLLMERRRYVKDALLMGKDDPEGLQEDLRKQAPECTKETVKTLNEKSDEWASIDQVGALINPMALVCPCCVSAGADEDDPVKGELAADRDDFV